MWINVCADGQTCFIYLFLLKLKQKDINTQTVFGKTQGALGLRWSRYTRFWVYNAHSLKNWDVLRRERRTYSTSGTYWKICSNKAYVWARKLVSCHKATYAVLGCLKWVFRFLLTVIQHPVALLLVLNECSPINVEKHSQCSKLTLV